MSAFVQRKSAREIQMENKSDAPSRPAYFSERAAASPAASNEVNQQTGVSSAIQPPE